MGKEKDEYDVAVLNSDPDVHGYINDQLDEKNEIASTPSLEAGEEKEVQADLLITKDDLLEAEDFIKTLSLEDTHKILTQVLSIHRDDPNFSSSVIQKIEHFLADETILTKPEAHAHLIYEMKIEAALIVNNSPYAEVRAVVANDDDPSLPVGTVRAYVIGLAFVVLGAVVNQLFSIRQPAITIGAVVSQLLSYPVGKACERLLPDWGFSLFGSRISLNPGKFNKKEHMLITIMANVGFSTPYTDSVIWTQKLPAFYNAQFAGNFGYQILISLGTNLLGYGMAGLTRQFLLYPAHCVWPTSLVTIALNSSFHSDTNQPVLGPFGKIYRSSRYKMFLILFGAMFLYFWIPNSLAQFTSYFNWPTWGSPNNINLVTILGSVNGMGLFNPLSTFDWNIVTFNGDPLVLPFFNIVNGWIGMFIGAPIILAMWYTNTYNTGYLPIISNRVFDHGGKAYNVSRAIDSRGIFDQAKYSAYSQAYIGAGNLISYTFFFATYGAMVTYAFLYHRHEIVLGCKNMFKKKRPDEIHLDKHNRLMSVYKECPEWWYLIVLVIATGLSVAGIAAFPTYTTPGVVFYGLLLCALFVIPVGIIYSITGYQITLNVLAEFIGGAWVEGNATSLNFFKTFGYVTCAHALAFTHDLKLGHYCKIPPRQTFVAQIVATIVSTFVCISILNFQMNKIDRVCEVDQPDHYTCPGVATFFTASVLWGSIGPKKVFGVGGQYSWTLFAFPIGLLFPIPFYYLRRKYPSNTIIRSIHPVILLGANMMWSPYNLSYVWPGVPVGFLSMVIVKKRFLGFWSKYNYVISASFASAIAISGIIQFFGIAWPGITIDWWGNNVSYEGCEGTACRLFKIPARGYFGPEAGSWK